jgi:hypothetical protein
MKIGTRSVLFGAHAFWLHPLFVAAAWWKLYGFPRDPRLWVAFFVHDIGYIGKPDMDGVKGESHPLLGARIMGAFDVLMWRPRDPRDILPLLMNRIFGRCDQAGEVGNPGDRRWYCFSLYHSRFMAWKHGARPSRLCAADKLATALEPWWLYVARATLTGEIREYMRDGPRRFPHAYPDGFIPDKRAWFINMATHARRWAEQERSAEWLRDHGLS